MAISTFRIPSDLSVSGVISSSGAVSASFFTSSQVGAFKGDGSSLTNVTASYLNDLAQAKVGLVALSASSYISASKFVGNGAEVTGVLTASYATTAGSAAGFTGNYVTTATAGNQVSITGGTDTGGGAIKGAITVAVSTTPSFSNVSTTDSAATASFAGSLSVGKNLIVLGDTVELQVGTLKIEDKVITVASGSGTAALADGSGIEFGDYVGSPKFLFNSSSNQLSSSIGLNVAAGNISASNGYVSASLGFVGDGSRLTSVTASYVSSGGLSLNGPVVETYTGSWTQGAQATLLSFATGSYAGGRFVLLAEDTLNNHRQLSEFTVIHKGTTAYITQYNDIYTDQKLGTLDASVSAGNINLLATFTNYPANTFTAGKFTLSRLYMVKPV